jgi:methanogenic corrinoid protein MtbC1
LQLFQDRLTEALLSQDTAEADEVLRRVLALYPLEDLIFQLIQPTLAQVGEAWQEGRISIAAEHMATHYLRHRLVTWLYTGPPTLPVPPTVLACAPGEWHEGSLLMLGILLRRRRWPVVYLGQSLPLPDLASFVKGLRPAAVVLVAMMEETARALEGWPRWLPNVKPRDAPLVAFGGRVFTVKPEWRERVPGLFLGETLAEGVERLERALRRRYPDG